MLQQLARTSCKNTRAIKRVTLLSPVKSELKRSFTKSTSIFARKVTVTEESNFRQNIQTNNYSFISDASVSDGGKGEGNKYWTAKSIHFFYFKFT